MRDSALHGAVRPDEILLIYRSDCVCMPAPSDWRLDAASSCCRRDAQLVPSARFKLHIHFPTTAHVPRVQRYILSAVPSPLLDSSDDRDRNDEFELDSFNVQPSKSVGVSSAAHVELLGTFPDVWPCPVLLSVEHHELTCADPATGSDGAWL